MTVSVLISNSLHARPGPEQTQQTPTSDIDTMGWRKTAEAPTRKHVKIFFRSHALNSGDDTYDAYQTHSHDPMNSMNMLAAGATHFCALCVHEKIHNSHTSFSLPFQFKIVPGTSDSVRRTLTGWLASELHLLGHNHEDCCYAEWWLHAERPYHQQRTTEGNICLQSPHKTRGIKHVYEFII